MAVGTAADLFDEAACQAFTFVSISFDYFQLEVKEPCGKYPSPSLLVAFRKVIRKPAYDLVDN